MLMEDEESISQVREGSGALATVLYSASTARIAILGFIIEAVQWSSK
jgi:hypothetical protein